MDFDLGAIVEQLKGMWERLSLAQRIGIPLLIVISAVLIVGVTSWSNQTEYKLLYSKLDEADAGEIIEALKEKKVLYRLRDEGKTVDVSPPELVHELRIELASTGLPKGTNVGYEIFNEATLGQTGFAEKINFVRALQGELERTISSIEAVEKARVHITAPKQSVFVKRDADPTASVMLKLKRGAELDERQIKGISHLVAGSVERLKPEDVTIMDSLGNMLNQPTGEEGFGGANIQQLRYKSKLETAYVERIESMLAAVLGPGKAVARVTADVDFDQFEKEEELYDPAGQVVRSERVVSEGANADLTGGVPGVASNLTNDPGLLTPPDSSKDNGSLRNESVKNFELSRSVSKTIAAAGSIARLTVAVMVDGQYQTVVSGAADVQNVDKLYKPLAPEMLTKIENLVKQAVGFDATRGDLVTVENMQFFDSQGAMAEAMSEASNFGDYVGEYLWLVPYVGSVLLMLLVFMVVLRPMVKFLVQPLDANVSLERLLPSGLGDLEAELSAERERLSELPQRTEAPEVDLTEVQDLLKENSNMVKDNPQQAALLIRYWLNESNF